MQQEWKGYGVEVLQTAAGEKAPLPEICSGEGAAQVRRFHRQLAAYEVTPLVSLPGLAGRLGLGGIYVKDESRRFGLNAFKGLGGSYAMFRILCEDLGLDPAVTTPADLMTPAVQEKVKHTVFVTATDGNHGRGVSWAGGLFGCRVYVYMPKGTVEERAAAIRRVGPAEVTITDWNYDMTVQHARQMAEAHGWHLIQDTSWAGYEDIPTWIVQGYLTMAVEAREQLAAAGARATHLFLQAGVGAMAGGVLGYFAAVCGAEKPITAIVEPNTVCCVYDSAKAGDGGVHPTEGDPVTIMAGLNCGTPCGVTWPVLRDRSDFFVACPDYAAAHGMRLYASRTGGDPAVISGESGASTLGALALLMERPELAEARRAMGLTKDSVVLLISTEGNTDPDGYRAIVEENAYPLPVD